MTQEQDASVVLAQLRSMLEGSHQIGMVPDRLKLPEIDGATGQSAATTACNPDTMKRVARALADLTHTMPDGRGDMRPASILERLRAAGCPLEMYYEMAETREFIGIYGRVCTQLHVIPLIAQVMAAQMAKAGAGDDKAARIVFELTRLMDRSTVEDTRREYAQLGDEDFWKTLRMEAVDTLEMVEEATSGVPREARIKCTLCQRVLPEKQVIPPVPAIETVAVDALPSQG